MPFDEYILSVPSPCSENWHQMLPEQKGRFCQHCSKSVIDFTGLNDAQIIELLAHNKGHICGRLNTGQLNRVVSSQQMVWASSSRLKEIFAALLLYASARQAYATKPTTLQVTTYNTFTETGADNKDSITLYNLNGTVVDSAFHADFLIGASVKNKTRDLQRFTDFDGKFSIDAAEGDTIEISYLGFKTHTYVVHGFDNKEYTLAYKYDNRLTGEVVIIKSTKKATLRHKIRRFFGIKNR
jgi:hypothetical protein